MEKMYGYSIPCHTIIILCWIDMVENMGNNLKTGVIKQKSHGDAMLDEGTPGTLTRSHTRELTRLVDIDHEDELGAMVEHQDKEKRKDLTKISKRSLKSAENRSFKIHEIKTLMEIVDSPWGWDPYVRAAAVEAVGEIGDVKAIYPFLIALGDIDSLIRSKAAKALVKIDDLIR